MTKLTNERLAEIEARHKAASRGPWEAGRMVNEKGEPLTVEEIAEYVKNCVLISAQQSGTTDFLFVTCKKEDGDYDVCHVGNGPTSGHNAQFIAMARDVVPALIAEVRRLREERESDRKTMARLCEGLRQSAPLCDGCNEPMLFNERFHCEGCCKTAPAPRETVARMAPVVAAVARCFFSDAQEDLVSAVKEYQESEARDEA